MLPFFISAPHAPATSTTTSTTTSEAAKKQLFYQEKNIFDDAVLTEMTHTLLQSKLVGESTLSGTFSKNRSRGFATVFTKEGAAQLLQKWPILSTYWHWLNRKHENKNTDIPANLAREGNAFYMNVLMVPPLPYEGIGAHVDSTLSGICGWKDARPYCVSVVYLTVPSFLSGGELCLWNDGSMLAEIKPIQHQAVHFDGSLVHAVKPWKRYGHRILQRVDPVPYRVSLVCEQYQLPDEHLEQMPIFRVQSKGFQDVLNGVLAKREQR